MKAEKQVKVKSNSPSHNIFKSLDSLRGIGNPLPDPKEAQRPVIQKYSVFDGPLSPTKFTPSEEISVNFNQVEFEHVPLAVPPMAANFFKVTAYFDYLDLQNQG